MGRLPDTDEGVGAARRAVINRFDADRSLKAQIPELEDWSSVSSSEDRARNTDDSWPFTASHLESGYCSAALERKEMADFLIIPPQQSFHLITSQKACVKAPSVPFSLQLLMIYQHSTCDASVIQLVSNTV